MLSQRKQDLRTQQELKDQKFKDLAEKQGPGRKHGRNVAAARRRKDKRNHLQKSFDANKLFKKKYWDLKDGRDFSNVDKSWLAVHHPKGKFFHFDRKGREYTRK